MPSHTHSQNAHSHSTKESIAVRTMTSDGNETVLRSAGRSWSPTMPQSSTGVTENRTAVNNNTGGSKAHNNLQPYITCYM